MKVLARLLAHAHGVIPRQTGLMRLPGARPAMAARFAVLLTLLSLLSAAATSNSTSLYVWHRVRGTATACKCCSCNW